jgi:TolB-like protein/Flp pilus assembly protein TadD
MGQSLFKHIRHFWRELHRRRVLHAIGIYLAGSWLLLQIFDVALKQIGMPEWAMTLSVWLIFVGAPLVLLFSWRYEISADGIRRTVPRERDLTDDLAIKPVDYLVIAFILVFLVVVSVSLTQILKTDTPERLINEALPNSIAVLPFENMGGQSDDDYLGRGLAEDILHRLASLGELQVASRTASFDLDTSQLDMPAIGQRLGVNSLLEGSVRRDGNRLRIVAQLIDARSGYHLWSGSYDRELEDLFGIYDEISIAVVTELQLKLTPNTKVILVPPTNDMQAYDYFLQARSMLQRSTHSENAENAQKFFSKAVAIDPYFAQAWAGQCQSFLDWYNYQPTVEKIQQAEASCLRAIELDPELIEGHVALGDLYRITGRFAESVDEYQSALQADANTAMAWRGLGQVFVELERDAEAESAMTRAIELDPNDLAGFFALGDFYFSRGRYREAVNVYEQLASHPNAGASAYNSEGAAYYMLGEFEKAAEAYRQVVAAEPMAAAYSNIGIMYFYNGQFEDASIMYREAIVLAPENPVWWGNLADSLREIDGDEEDVEIAYRKAADLAGALLPANPEDAELLTNLAHYHARLGDDERATQYIARALIKSPDDVYAHYYAALVHLEAGRRQQALEEITRSVELGYPKALLAPDPQFSELLSNESFMGLIKIPAQTEEH